MLISMGDPPSSYTISSPPRPLSPPPPPPKSNSMPMLYYGLVVVGTAAIVLALYNLIIIRWCADQRPQQRLGPTNTRPLPGRVEQRQAAATPNQSLDNQLNVNLISRSFKYKKEGSPAKDQVNIDFYECAVCLSVFEEGEEVRQLPRCKHSFHAPCIDMWLYSHLDCPLCRSPVEPPVLCPSPVAPPIPNRYVNNPRQAARGGGSREGSLDPSIFGL